MGAGCRVSAPSLAPVKVAFKLNFHCLGPANTHQIVLRLESKQKVAAHSAFPVTFLHVQVRKQFASSASLALRANRQEQPVEFGPSALMICRGGDCEVDRDRRHISPVPFDSHSAAER